MKNVQNSQVYPPKVERSNAKIQKLTESFHKLHDVFEQFKISQEILLRHSYVLLREKEIEKR